MKFDPKKLNALAVCLHGRQIGVINRLAGERHIFAFEQDYIADPQRPTLSLSFKSSTGGLVTADRRTPVLYPAYDFVATLPYLHGDTLALTFGGGRSLAGITTDQMRHFADAARIPASGRLRWRRAERTVRAWKALEQTDLLPKDMRTSIEKQILAVASTTK